MTDDRRGRTAAGSVRGEVAVVTGAGSGIGRHSAFEPARRGARLALSDVDERGLGETVRTNIATAAFEHARTQGQGVTAADEARHRAYTA